MENGFVIFCISKKDRRPYFLKFSNGWIFEKEKVEDATVYPFYEAVETVFNDIKDSDAYLILKICYADGTPCDSEGYGDLEDSEYLRG